ncbi:MAG: YrdB family protein [Gemmatimonadaceae bacterium]
MVGTGARSTVGRKVAETRSALGAIAASPSDTLHRVATLRLINLGVRFLLELASLGAFAYWGASLPARTMVRGVAAVGIPLAVALLWGVFISPKARIPTGHAGRAGLGLLVFLAAALALADRSHHVAAVAFAIVALGSSLLLYRLPQ